MENRELHARFEPYSINWSGSTDERGAFLSKLGERGQFLPSPPLKNDLYNRFQAYTSVVVVYHVTVVAMVVNSQFLIYRYIETC